MLFRSGNCADFGFKVYITENDTAVTMPTGYTQKALIGYVRNDSGSDFRPFIQINRNVSSLLDDLATISTTGLPVLTDVSVAVPPIPVTVSLTMYGTANKYAFAFPGADDNLSTKSPGAARGDTGANGYTVPMGPTIAIDQQILYLEVQAGASITFQIAAWSW